MTVVCVRSNACWATSRDQSYCQPLDPVSPPVSWTAFTASMAASSSSRNDFGLAGSGLLPPNIEDLIGPDGDLDGDGIPNYLDDDMDGDGLLDGLPLRLVLDLD